MANYCYNNMDIGGATLEGSQKFIKELGKENFIQCPDQYPIDIQYEEDGNGIIYNLTFETRWSTYESTVEYLAKLLGSDYATCEYEEGGSQIGGVFTYEEESVSDLEVLDAYWVDLNNAYELGYDPIDMDNYYTHKDVIVTRIHNISHEADDIAPILVAVALNLNRANVIIQ